MKNKWLATLTASTLLAGCAFGNPDAKGFSVIFNEVWDHYEITVNESDYPTMNYQIDMEGSSPSYTNIEATIKINEDSAYLFAHFDYVPEEGASTYFSYEAEGYADFTTEMFYYELINYDTPNGTTTLVETGRDKFAVNMNDVEAEGFSMNIAGTIRSQIVDGVLPKLGDAKIIDLLIGVKAPVDDVYNFSVSLNNLVDFSFMNPFLGADPENPTLSLSFNRVTFDTELGIDFTVGAESYDAVLALSRLDEVTDSETKLTSTQIASYTN